MRRLLASAIALASAQRAAGAASRRGLQNTDRECWGTSAPGGETAVGPPLDNPSNTYYFDIASLTCQDCPAGQLRSEDGLSCVCNLADPCPSDAPGFPDDCACKVCDPADQVYASQDGTVCMACEALGGSSNPAGDGTDCRCAGANERLVEFDAVGKRLANGKGCEACPDFSYVDPADPYSCVPCPGDGEHAAECGCAADSCADTCAEGATCSCTNEKSGISLGACVDEAWLTEIPSTVQSGYATLSYELVSNGESDAGTVSSVVSQTFKDLFWPNAVRCLRVADAFAKEAGPVQLERLQGCQALANLCVLQDYDEGDSTVCKLFAEGGALSTQAAGEFVNERSEWVKHLPWLYHRDHSRADSSQIKMKVGFTASEATNDAALGIIRTLPFKLSAYALDGTWLGFEDLTTQLDVCSDLPFGTAGNTPDYLNVGYSTLKTCTLDIASYLDAETAPLQKFYDLYLVDADGALVPTVTKLINYRDSRSREFVNVDSNDGADLTDEQFTGRFFLYDRVSSLQSAGAAQPRVLRYPKSVKLTITVTNLGQPPSIFVPIVTIEYGTIEVGAISDDWDGTTVNMKFSVEYVKDLESFKEALVILFGICSTLAFCFWVVSIIRISRNRPSGAVDSEFLVRALFEMIGHGTRWSFILMFMVCLYWWFFFKLQPEVHTLLPVEDDLKPFEVLLSMAFVGQILHLGFTLNRQCNIDAFFIDWEKSHGALKQPAVNEHVEEGGESKENMAPVSYWRSIFITNEWSELQTARMVNVELTLLGLVFLLRGCDLDNLATSNPEYEDLRGPEDGGSSIDPLLHFFIGSFFIILLSGCQMLFMKVFWHRYVCNPLENFIDLLFTANLSAMILSDGHAGFYLGGNGAPHPHMDTSMAHLQDLLRQEEQGRTKQRGLNGDGILTYVVFLKPKMREFYDAQFKRLMHGVHNPGAMSSKDNSRAPHPADSAAVKAYDQLNKLWMKFIMNQDATNDYAKRILPMTSGMKMFPLFNPEAGKQKQTLMYEDTQNAWASMLLYGIEVDLMVFLCWCFAWGYHVFDHTTSAACFTYVMHLAMTYYRSSWGKDNLAKKTLVDARFLTT